MSYSCLRRQGRRVCAFLCLIAASTTVIFGQLAASAPAAAIPNRVNPSADWVRRQALANHVPLWANAQNVIGAVAQPISATMILSRSPEQQAALEQLLADQANPSSPEFRHWLTPAEFGERFGVSQADADAVKGWLESQGLRVTFVAASRTFIGFTGSADVVGRAFGTTVRTYSVRGQQRFSVASAPNIPAAIAPVVKSIHGLYTIDDQPMHLATEPQAAGPSLSLSNGNNYVTPNDFSGIYDQPLGLSGYQQTIGIAGRARTNFDDFRNFSRVTSSGPPVPTEIVPTAFGGVDPGPAYTAPPPSGVSLGEQSEATLDVTRAGSVARGAKLLLVVATAQSGGIEADAQYLVQTSPLPAQVMTISYGACEATAGPSGVNFWDTLFQQAAAEGISVFVASGDSGAAGCEPAFQSASATPPAISPNYICSSSYATCVGGTEFNDFTNPGQYWDSSSHSMRSAIGYIPEGGWNEPVSKSNYVVAGSGGGVSNVIATPAWQSGSGVPAARAGRYTPDVSFTSSCHDSYFMCLAAAGADCVADSTGSYYFLGMCGTSAAAPSMAGVAALLNGKMQYPLGNLNPAIYALAQNQPAVFHDATPATSGVSNCDIHTPSMCNNSVPGVASLTGGQDGYPITAGYDMVTGVGSLDIAKFLDAFATALPQPTIAVTPKLTTMYADQEVTVNIQVSAVNGQPQPTGFVQVNAGAFHSSNLTLTNGAVAVVIPPNTLYGSVFPVTISATYTPDLNSVSRYSQSRGSASISVMLMDPTVDITFAPTNPTTAQDLSVLVSVTGPNSHAVPTGSIFVEPSLAGTSFTTTENLSNGQATLTIPAGILPGGSNSMAVIYMPDLPGASLYKLENLQASVNVAAAQKTTPTVVAIASPASPTIADSLSLAVTVKPASGAPTPTGRITAQAGAYQGTFTLAGGSTLASFSATSLSVGANTVTVSYTGDANYNPTSGVFPLQVSKAVSTVMLGVPTNYPLISDSIPVTVSVAQLNGVPGATGTVTLTTGSFTSGAVALNGPANISIPANTLAVGANTITAVYSGDGFHQAATASIMVTGVAPTPGIMLGTNDVTLTAGATTNNKSTITVTPTGGFMGSVDLTASIGQGPSNPDYPPTFSFGTTSPVNITGATAGSATLTITTTAATKAQLQNPWYLPAGTSLALILLFGIPARRRKLRSLFGVLALLVFTFAGISACGGGGGGSGPPSTPAPTGHAGTTPGTYYVLVTATSGSLSNRATVKLIVQ